MGKKRHTAKTGDRSLYKSRGRHNLVEKDHGHADDDTMHDEVDRYNNVRDELQEDMLRFGEDGQNKEESEEAEVENVFDLGLGGSESEYDEESHGTESSDDQVVDSNFDNEQDESSSSSEDDVQEEDTLNWGKKKHDYYDGDTADLEIGQEREDADMEVKAGREVLKVRMEGMTEDDFELDFEEDDRTTKNQEKKENNNEEKESQHCGIKRETQLKKRKSLAMLSKREKIKLLKKTHPDFPLISYFREHVIRPCVEETLVVTNALFQHDRNIEAVGATNAGLQYLLSKAMLQTSSALNLCQYLLIKADKSKQASTRKTDELNFDIEEEEGIKAHPVVRRLNQLNSLLEKLKDIERNTEGLTHQVESIVKASALMTDEIKIDDGVEKKSEEMVNAAETLGESIDDQSSVDNVDNASSYSASSEEEDITAVQRRVMVERFSLRHEDDKDFEESGSQRHTMPSFSEYGDDDDANQNDITDSGKVLASTINAISQRNKSRKNLTRIQPEEEDNDHSDERLLRGLDMMEAEVGGGDENAVSDAESNDNFKDNGRDDFYTKISERSKQKKKEKEGMYAVAPKYPRLDAEIDGERAIGRVIMKNRGLVAHKAKINRNPRVKKREQYRKAIISRKGAVREVRTDEGHKYGGEQTGIKSNISRSRKL